MMLTPIPLTGRMSPSKFVELNCTNAAKLYGMYPQSRPHRPLRHEEQTLTPLSHAEGTIQPGSDADFVIWRSPTARKTSKVTVSNVSTPTAYLPDTRNVG